MKISEILSFHGRPCTKDCSGHKAGWDWERKHQTNQPTASTSPSFNDGADIAISQRKANKQPIGPSVRGEKGRFVKVQQVQKR